MTSRQRRGAEVFGEQLADGLSARGWDVVFRALVDAEEPTVRAPALVERDRSGLGPLDRDVIGALRRQVATHRSDVVFANGSATLRYAVASMVPRSRAKLVYGSIGEPAWWSSSRLARLRTRALLSRTAAVTSVSTATARQLVDDIGVPEERVAVAPVGVARSFGEITPEPASDHLRVLFLGSLSAEKGPDVALRAVREASSHADMRFRIVGGGPMAELLEHQVDAHGLARTVTLVGPVGDVRPHLAWADVLVLSSKTEGLPGVLLEAGAAGVPAIAFDVGGVSDIVVDGVTGRLVPRGDEAALVTALRESAADRPAIARMADAVSARVLSGYTHDHVIDRYDQIFRAVADDDRVPTALEA